MEDNITTQTVHNKRILYHHAKSVTENIKVSSYV